MEMIDVKVKRTEAVSVEAASVIAAAFLEWIDTKGFVLTGRPGTQAGTAQLKEASYEELAQMFLEEWS